MDKLFAEAVETEFDLGEDTVPVHQVRLSIFGDEFLLDPDQATSLWNDILTSLNEINRKSK